MQNPVLYWLD